MSVALPSIACHDTAQESDSEPMSVQEFVSQTFYSGVPYRESTALGPAAVPQLISMLRDPEWETHWSHIATVLAMLAEPSGVEAVIRFIEDPSEPTPERSWARSNAVLSLGYAAHAGRSPRALRYLEESLEPGIWQRRGMQSAGDAIDEEEGEDGGALTELAILGLALSGTPEGRRTIVGYRDAPGRTQSERDTLETALAEHEKIVEMGLAAYDAARQAQSEN